MLSLPLLLPLLLSLSSLPSSFLSPSSLTNVALAAPAPAPQEAGSIFAPAEADLEKRSPLPAPVPGGGGGGGGGYGGYGDDYHSEDDYKRDWCPRRFYRNRYGKCVRNHGYGGCRWGYRRNRWGFCVRDHHDYDSDDEYDRGWRHGGWGRRRGWCPRNYRADGSGHDGYPFDSRGDGPPSWVPQGWLYYGEGIGWAPYKGWTPSPSWRPPVIFLKIVVKVVWWSPSRDWCAYYSHNNRWSSAGYSSYKIPEHWNWHPSTSRGRQYKARSLAATADADEGKGEEA